MDCTASERGLSWLARFYLASLVIAHFGLLIYGIYIHGPGYDEIGHLASGISHWQTGRFDCYRVNPPLQRLVATAPLMFHDVGFDWMWNTGYTTARPEWEISTRLIEGKGKAYYYLLRTARWAGLVFAAVALWVIFQWSRELFGVQGALLSLTVWCFSPMVLANFQMVTPDPAATAMGAVAAYAFRHWLRECTVMAAFLCGIAMGFAELSKFTWLILYALWPVQWLLCRWLVPSSATPRTDLVHLSLIFAVSIFTINAAYGFEDSFLRLGTFRFNSNALGGDHQNDASGNLFQGTILAHVPVPLPANLITGIDRQKVDFESKLWSYLRGVERQEGWWYYYLYGLLVKEPSGYLILGVMFLSLMATRGWCRQNFLELVHLLLPGVALFTFVSSQTGFNHHMRYVLPSLIFIAIALGMCCSKLVARPRERAIAWVLALAGVVASLSEFPHSHAFFNMLAGGPNYGVYHLQDSNVDWGQDILLLEKWAKQNSDKPLDGVAYVLGIGTGVRELTDLPRKEISRDPLPGRYALSILHVHDPSSKYRYFKNLLPVARVGRTTLIFEVSLDDANRIRAANGLPLLPPG